VDGISIFRYNHRISEVNDDDIYTILLEGIHIPEIIPRIKKALMEDIYIPAIIDDIYMTPLEG
jgi:hypothetical protein